MDAKKVIKYVVFIVVLGNLALMAYVFLGAASPKPAPMPNPNGYDDFVKAVPLLSNLSLGDYTKESRAELIAHLAGTEEALKFLESGISKECRVSDDYSPGSFTNIVIPRLMAWKEADFLFCAEGRLAELESRTNDAVRYYVEGLQFAEKYAHGGMILAKWSSKTSQALLASRLQKMLLLFNAKQCANVAHIFESLEADEETDDEILRHEREFANAYDGVRGQFVRLITYKRINASNQSFLVKTHAWTKQRRQLMLTFAARAYELDKGKPPAAAADLVPGYLKKIPQDPVTGTNLIWQP